MEQINHYYPYGGLMADICTGSDVQPYKYNGKELDRMHGLDTYDYGARQHNAATGRWDRMDQLAEENPEVSPYVYCMDNPAKFIDLDGKEPTLAEAVRIAAHVYGDKSNSILTGGWQVSKKNFGILLNTNNTSVGIGKSCRR